MNKIITNLKKRIFKYLKVKYWGVGFELDLPPEFVITPHAELRIKQRLGLARMNLPELCLDIWYDGEKAPEDFKPEMADTKNIKKRYGKFKYKFYDSNIYVFGVWYSKYYHDGQKHLITVYRWNKPLQSS